MLAGSGSPASIQALILAAFAALYSRPYSRFASLQSGHLHPELYELYVPCCVFSLFMVATISQRYDIDPFCREEGYSIVMPKRRDSKTGRYIEGGRADDHKTETLTLEQTPSSISQGWRDSQQQAKNQKMDGEQRRRRWRAVDSARAVYERQLDELHSIPIPSRKVGDLLPWRFSKVRATEQRIQTELSQKNKQVNAAAADMVKAYYELGYDTHHDAMLTQYPHRVANEAANQLASWIMNAPDILYRAHQHDPEAIEPMAQTLYKLGYDLSGRDRSFYLRRKLETIIDQ